MNEELDGLVSLGIERGRDFNYISKVLGEEGFSAAEIKAAEALYNQKKKSQAVPTSESKPKVDSGVSVSAGPRVGKSVSEPSTQVPKPGLKVDITAGSVGPAMGALQFATTGVAPVSIEEKKKLVSDNEVIASQLSEQRKKSAGIYIANKQAGKDPYLDPEFQAQKQRENELIEQSAQIKQQLHPELAPEAFVKYNEKGEAQETPVSEVKYIQDAISVLPAMEQDQRMAQRAIDIQKQYEGEFKEISKFGNIPLVSSAANAAVAVGSGLTSMLADVAQFITEPFAATQEGEYEGVIPETAEAIYSGARSLSEAMRFQRGVNLENIGLTPAQQDKDPFSLIAEGDVEAGYKSLGIMVGDAAMFSQAIGALYGVGSVASSTKLGQAFLASEQQGAKAIVNKVYNNVATNVAESPVMFGAMATLSAQQGWDAVKNRADLSVADKIFYASVGTAANTITEALNIDDLKLVSKGLDGAARETALKSFSGTLKQYVKDMGQIGTPEAFEETINFYADALAKYVIDGKLPTATDPLTSIAVGFLAPSLNVTATYAPSIIESAIATTPWKMAKTKEFERNRQLAEEKGKITEALAAENLPQSERKVLMKALEDVDSAIADQERKDFEFYSGMEYADANEILNLHAQIGTKVQQYKKTRSNEVRSVLEAEIRNLFNRKLEIESRYDSTQKTGVSSSVFQGQAPQQAGPQQGAGQETIEASGVLQVPTEEGPEVTQAEEATRMDASKGASEEFSVGAIVPGKVVTEGLARVMNNIFSATRAVVQGGKVVFHYSQESIANVNEATKAQKKRNPRAVIDGFYDKTNKKFHVYIPTAADTAKVVKTEDGKYALVDPKYGGQVVSTFKDRTAAFQAKQTYDAKYIEFATTKARHEAIHPVIDALIFEDKPVLDENGNQVLDEVGQPQVIPNSFRQYLYDSIVELYSSSPDAQRIFDSFLDPYIAMGADSRTMQREAITEFFARMGDEQRFKQLDKGFIQKVKDLLNQLLVRAGIRDVSISTDDDLYTVARAFNTAMKLGVEVKIANKGWRDYKPVGELFSPDMLEGLEASDLTEKELRRVIATGKFGMVTGQNPRGTKFPAEVRDRFNREAKTWLEEKGYSVIPILGKFEGIAENSYLVPRLSSDDAVAFAKRFNQAAVAHSAGFIYFDGSFVPRNKNGNVYGVNYNDTESDYFSAMRTKDGKLTAFKVDYDWGTRMNYQALEDGLTNQIDFSITAPEGQSYVEFFDSVNDPHLRSQATMLQLLAEKFNYSKEILFSANGVTSFDESKDYVIFNVAKDKELNQAFGYFANAFSTLAAKENMALYRGLLDQTAKQFPELVETEIKEVTNKYQAELRDRQTKQEFLGGYEDFIKRLAIRNVLDNKMVEFFKTNETDFEALRKNWDSNKKLIGEAIGIDITDIFPSTKMDGVMELLVNPAREIYAGTEVAKRIKSEYLRGGQLGATPTALQIGLNELNDLISTVYEDSEVLLDVSPQYSPYAINKSFANDLLSAVVELDAPDKSLIGIALEARANVDPDDFDSFTFYRILRTPYLAWDISEFPSDIESLEESKRLVNEKLEELKDILANTKKEAEEYIASTGLTASNLMVYTAERELDIFLNVVNGFIDYWSDPGDSGGFFVVSYISDRLDDKSRDSRTTLEEASMGLGAISSLITDFILRSSDKSFDVNNVYPSMRNLDRLPKSMSELEFLVGNKTVSLKRTNLSPDYKVRTTLSQLNFQQVENASLYNAFDSNLIDYRAYAKIASNFISDLRSNTRVERIKIKGTEGLATSRVEVFIPKLNDTYTVNGMFLDGDVNVSFHSNTTGYNLKDPGAALSVMPEVIKAIGRMFPERDVRTISFTPLEADTAKRSDGELRRGVYRMFAQRLFGNYFPVGVTQDDENVIPIPYVFRSMPETTAIYEDMINKTVNNADVSFAITNFDNIPAEVTEGLNTINNAVSFAAASSFPNKIIFKEELQKRFKMYEKELKKKYGITSFEVGGRGKKAIDEGLKRYLVDAYTYETLVAIEAYPDALGWYDYKTRAAMEIMALIHPELNTDKNAADAFKIALAITSNGNKVAANFEEADRQYEYYKKNGKFDSNTSIGTQSAGIKSTFKMVNTVLERMSMDEFSSFLTSKFRAGDLKYIKNGKSESLLSGFTVDTEVYGAAIFGPKIGNGFYMNLNGEFDQLTMDRWFMRQFGRLTGTLIKRDPAKLAAGKTRLKNAISTLSTKDKAVLGKVIPGFGKMTLEEKANAINKASIDADKRAEISATKELNEVRLAGNNYSKNLSGEVEAPSGGNQRSFIIDVFNEVQKELKEKYGINITIADLQAVNWYPEKALYQTFQEGRDEDFGATETSDNEQPDYENAAIGLALKRGINNEQIENARRATERGERIAVSVGQRASLIGRDNTKASAEEIRRRILSVKAGEEQRVDFSISVEAPEFEAPKNKIRQFAERMADSNIKLYADIIENPNNYYTPQKLEDIQGRLALMTVPELLNEMTTDKVNELSASIKVDLYDEDNVTVLLGAELIKRYSAEGDEAKLLDMIERMSKMGTTVGRMLRHFGEIKNSTHLGIVQTVVVMAQRAGRRLTESQMVKLNDLAVKLFNLQTEANTLMYTAMHSPSKELDQQIKNKEKELKAATKNLDDFIMTAIPKATMDIFGALVKGNLLTPISQSVNVFANLANVATRQFLVAPVASVIDFVRAFTSGKNREITPSVGAFIFGVKRAAFMGVPEAVEYIFKGTRPTEETFQYESRQGFIPLQAIVAAFSDTKIAAAINKAAGKEVIKGDQLARLQDGSIAISDRLKKITEGTFGIAPEVMFRLLTLGDRPFARFAEGVEIYRRGKKLGLKGEALDNFVKHPDPVTIKAGREAGREITYQADTSFSIAVQTILSQLSKTRLGSFLTTIIVPFSKTPSNIIYDTLNYVAPPVAIGRAVIAAKNRRYDDFSTLLAKSAVGFSIYAVADFLIKNGLATAGIGDDEKKERELFYAQFPYNSINVSALMRKLKGEDATLNVEEDVFIDYSKAGPIGAIIGARASYWANKEVKPTSVAEEAEAYSEMATLYLSEMLGTTMSSFQFMAQQSFLANTNQILELLTTQGEINPDYILTSLFRTTSAAVLPNSLSALNRTTRTKLPDLYDKNSLYNSLTNVIKDRTFSTDDVPVRYNIWGEGIEQTPQGANPVLFHLFDPVKYQKRIYEPHKQEVFRLYETLGQDTRVIPGYPRELDSRKFKDEETGIEYTFTNEEVNDMIRALAEERTKRMKELIAQDWYQSYPDEDKAYELEYLYKDISKNGEWKQLLYNYKEVAKQQNRIKE